MCKRCRQAIQRSENARAIQREHARRDEKAKREKAEQDAAARAAAEKARQEQEDARRRAAEQVAEAERAAERERKAEETRKEAERVWHVAQQYVAVRYGLIPGPPEIERAQFAPLVIQKTLGIVACLATDAQANQKAAAITNGSAQAVQVVGFVGAAAAAIAQAHPLLGLAALAAAAIAEPVAKELNSARQSQAVERWVSLYEALSDEEKVLFLILLEVHHPELRQKWVRHIPTLTA